MTTFTTIGTGSLAVGKPLTSALAIALRDNPIAIAEGDATAPRIEWAALGAWYDTAGGIGTYCFARATVDKAFGDNIAGSALNPTSAMAGASTNALGAFDFAQGAALSGSWRCMGHFDLQAASAPAATALLYGATLWLRYA
jgi:hypothetical protein